MQGLLYDVHGNLPALEAVLADARSAGVDRWVLGGDYALFGGWPQETVQRLRELSPAVWIRGNGERWTADPSAAPDNEVVPGAVEAAREALGADLVEDLASLPFSCALEQMFVCHGSPLSDVRSFGTEPTDEEAELLAGTEAPRILFGHTHVPFARRSSVALLELVNPGSVGMPFDGDTRAAYAIAHDDGSIEHRRVAYDHGAAVERLRGIGARWADVVALRVERATMDV